MDCSIEKNKGERYSGKRERRCVSRTSTNARAYVSRQGSPRFKGKVRDLSSTGAFVATGPLPIREQHVVNLNLVLDLGSVVRRPSWSAGRARVSHSSSSDHATRLPVPAPVWHACAGTVASALAGSRELGLEFQQARHVGAYMNPRFRRHGDHRTAACLATARQPNLLQQIQLSNDSWPWYAGHIRDAAHIDRLAGMQVSHGRTGRDKKGFKAARVDVPEFPIGRQKK